MMNVELSLSLPEQERVLQKEALATQIFREQSSALRAINALGRLADHLTDTNKKKIAGFVGMMLISYVSMLVDGNVNLVVSGVTGGITGAVLEDRIPFVSCPIGLAQAGVEKAIGIFKKNTDPKNSVEIARSLTKHEDIVSLKELSFWEQGERGKESSLHPDRYKLVQKMFKSEKTPEVEKKFMEAQIIAQKERGSQKYIGKEIIIKAINMIAGAVFGVGAVVLAHTGAICSPKLESWVGLGDDVVFWTVYLSSKAWDKTKAFLLGF